MHQLLEDEGLRRKMDGIICDALRKHDLSRGQEVEIITAYIRGFDRDKEGALESREQEAARSAHEAAAVLCHRCVGHL